MEVYIVEVESGCTSDNGAMLFDSVWTSRESAEAYAKAKFAQAGYASQVPDYTVTPVTLEE
jgi:hypothetical protein